MHKRRKPITTGNESKLEAFFEQTGINKVLRLTSLPLRKEHSGDSDMQQQQTTAQTGHMPTTKTPYSSDSGTAD